MFLTVPVTPWAYSGLAMSSASAARIRACNATTAEGNNSSRSGLKSGNSPAPQRRLICTSGGAKRAAARRSAELIEEALRLPEIARTLMTPNDTETILWMLMSLSPARPLQRVVRQHLRCCLVPPAPDFHTLITFH